MTGTACGSGGQEFDNDSMTIPAAPTGLFLRQKITMIANKYWVHTLDASGKPGALVAFAEQKKLKLREEVTFYADESKSDMLFGFKSRQIVDMAATTDVFDAQRRPIGMFRKSAVRSLLNSTWYVEGDGVAATGSERSRRIALVRRFGGMLPFVGGLLEAIPWQFHFDFYDSSTQLVMSVERQRAIRDQYRIVLPPTSLGPPLDWRLAAAVGVALDAFQGR